MVGNGVAGRHQGRVHLDRRIRPRQARAGGDDVRIAACTSCSDPAWSPDGKSIVFTAAACGARPVAGPPARRLTTGANASEYQPRSRPTERGSRSSSGTSYPFGDLEVIRSTAPDASALLEGRVSAFAWAPDGKRLAAIAGATPNAEDAYLVSLDGAATRLTASPQSVMGAGVLVRRLARADRRGPPTVIRVFDAAGKPFARIAPEREPAGLAWSPDGRRLAWGALGRLRVDGRRGSRSPRPTGATCTPLPEPRCSFGRVVAGRDAPRGRPRTTGPAGRDPGSSSSTRPRSRPGGSPTTATSPALTGTTDRGDGRRRRDRRTGRGRPDLRQLRERRHLRRRRRRRPRRLLGMGRARRRYGRRQARWRRRPRHADRRARAATASRPGREGRHPRPRRRGRHGVVRPGVRRRDRRPRRLGRRRLRGGAADGARRYVDARGRSGSCGAAKATTCSSAVR